MKLTKKQISALNELSADLDEWAALESLTATGNTLNSLRAKGLVDQRNTTLAGGGRVTNWYKLTDLGYDILMTFA